jgi:metal-responsive CopG/Arc/MetJ family transcriptional regulator
METIQVVLDSQLLRAANGAAKRPRVNRSQLIREALRDYLKRAGIQELEARDHKAYREHPQDAEEIAAWERVAAWPRKRRPFPR